MIALEDRKLDWRSHHDERSRDFPITAVAGEPTLRLKQWSIPDPLDQGREGACVPHGWIHDAMCTPIRVDFARVVKAPIKDPQTLAFWAYRRAQQLDHWVGEAYEGTSVLAGAKVMQELGLLKEYRWSFNIAGARRGVLTTGPGVLGLNWYGDMYRAPDGKLKVGGQLVGGHCVVLTAYAPIGKVFDDEAAYGILNSWGPDWGNNGFAWIREKDLARLLDEDGEACFPTKRAYGRAA